MKTERKKKEKNDANLIEFVARSDMGVTVFSASVLVWKSGVVAVAA